MTTTIMQIHLETGGGGANRFHGPHSQHLPRIHRDLGGCLTFGMEDGTRSSGFSGGVSREMSQSILELFWTITIVIVQNNSKMDSETDT
jgi:hypothetical protein